MTGRTLPDLELPDHAGNLRQLSQLAADDRLLLHFYRGWWYPKEQTYFRNLAWHHRRFCLAAGPTVRSVTNVA